MFYMVRNKIKAHSSFLFFLFLFFFSVMVYILGLVLSKLQRMF